MRHSPSRSDGRGHLTSAGDEAGPQARWLLVGNSRWHWAEATENGLRIRHCEAAESLSGTTAAPLAGWAAVGRLPIGWVPGPPGRVLTDDVPLGAKPAWLGVDRALAGWLAWRQSAEAVLVADAGTVLSLTRVDRDGCFSGGRLLAGLRLQWRAMAAGTAALPEAPAPGDLSDLLESGGWPAATSAAMAVGVVQGLAAALTEAFRQAAADLPGCRLVLTGGDAPLLLPLVRERLTGEADAVRLEPDLALRALVALRPAPGVRPGRDR